MLDEKEERIRAEAYRRWEQEGRPEGQHDRHWHEAAQAVNGNGAGAPLDSEGTTQALKVLKPRGGKPKAEKAVAKEKVEKVVKPAKTVEVTAPKAAAAKIAAPAAVVTEAPKRAKAKKAAAE